MTLIKSGSILRIQHSFISLFFLLSFFNLKAETTSQMPNGWTNGSGGVISTLAELRWLSETTDAWDEDWELGANIDASDTRTWNNGKGFYPIGRHTTQNDISSELNHFEGNFDGRYYKISNLYISSSARLIGLFGNAKGSQIKNVGLTQIDYSYDSTAISYVGGIAGILDENSNIYNSFVSGQINTKDTTANVSIGGISGSMHYETTSISNSHVNLNFNAPNSLIGGISAQAAGEVTLCFSVGYIIGRQAGGIIAHGPQVYENFSAANITGDTVGGIGVNPSNGNENTGHHTNHAIGQININKMGGGIFGYNPPFVGIAGSINNYFDTNTTSISVGIGNQNIARITPLSTIEFAEASNFPDWDFNTVWEINTIEDIDPNPRPYLQWIIVLKFSADSNGSISGDTSQFHNPGFDGEPVTAIPNEGYYFSCWQDGDGNTVDTSATLSLENLTDDLTLTATFSRIAHEVTYHASDNGSINGDTLQEVFHFDSTEEVIAAPDSGYHFLHWDNNGEVFDEDSNLVIDSIQSDLSLTAIFSINSYKVAFKAGENGSVSHTDTLTVDFGNNTPEVTAIANEGYLFQEWQNLSGEAISSANPLTLTNIHSDSTIIATFRIKPTYTLTFTTDNNGVLIGDSMQTIQHNEDANAITAVANSEFKFSGWFDEQEQLFSSENPLTLKNVLQDYMLKAIFINENSYSVHFLSDSNGYLMGDDTQFVPYNQPSDTIEAIANEHYHFVGWFDQANNLIDTNHTLIINPVLNDTTLTAKYQINNYTITFKTSEVGSLQGDTIQTIEYGESSTPVTALDQKGYDFVGWYNKENQNINENATITIDSVTEDQTISAIYDTQSYSFSAAPFGGSGIVNLSGSSARYGDTFTYEILVNQYSLDSAVYNGINITSNLIDSSGILMHRFAAEENGHLDVYFSNEIRTSLYNSPIPFKYHLIHDKIALSSSEQVQVYITNIHGMRVSETYVLNNGYLEIPLENIAPGIHFIILEKSLTERSVELFYRN